MNNIGGPLTPPKSPRQNSPTNTETKNLTSDIEKKEYFSANNNQAEKTNDKKRTSEEYSITQEKGSTNISHYFLTENRAAKKLRVSSENIDNNNNNISVNSSSSLNSGISTDIETTLSKWVADAPANEQMNRITAKEIILKTYNDEDRALNLHGLKLTSLPVAALNKLIHLETLNVGRNSLKVINKDTFKELKNLRVLDLSCNFLKTIPVGLFEFSYKLTQLQLNNNRLKEISLNILPLSLSNLESLNLNSNMLTRLGDKESFKNLTKLSTLSITNNHLHSLTNSFDLLENLTSLDISNNIHIRDLPLDIFSKLNKLTELYLLNIDLSDFTSEHCEGLTNLTHIHLRTNMLAEFPIFSRTQFPILKEIDITNNSFSDATIKLIESQYKNSGINVLTDNNQEYYQTDFEHI